MIALVVNQFFTVNSKSCSHCEFTLSYLWPTVCSIKTRPWLLSKPYKELLSIAPAVTSKGLRLLDSPYLGLR